ncbi:hypothetical protein ACRALDRAFT_1081029 [Sodiomyces alcalophilus JCM 7366]|uniref:uncharacterized protein n=1 Tax=Sodiomyces alcalophilus JCM 7366 TaxID=591952 RepID=UPI0039B5ABCF
METTSSTTNTYTGGSSSPVTTDKEYNGHRDYHPRHSHHDSIDHHHSGRSSDVHGYNQTLPSVSAAFGGALQPGLWRPYEHRKFANPAPLGLSAFALTTFVLSCANLHARNVTEPHIVVPLAFAYGGVVQLLAGMWEMAVGNTFGATALSSYGGFWIAYALLLTPTWGILSPDGPYAYDYAAHYSAIGFFLTGWFIFTSVLVLCTLRSTVAFLFLFCTLDLCFLFLACENYALAEGSLGIARNLQIAGGTFGMLAAFAAWYNALAGLQDDSNSFFRVPVIHLPWSEQGKEIRREKSRTDAV